MFFFTKQVPTPLTLSVRTKDNSQDTFTGNGGQSEITYLIPAAKSFFVFSGKSNLNLKFTGTVQMHIHENVLKFSLTNTSLGTTVLEKQWETEEANGLQINEETNCTIDSRYNYELTLFAEVNCGDNIKAISELNLLIT